MSRPAYFSRQFILREALNKSRHASCLHIFRLIARKLLEIHQVFLRRFHTIKRKICLRNLHTRFNQCFLKYDDIFKYSFFIICLLSGITGIKNAIDIQDINTKKKRALTLKNSAFEFQIYDKALESENKHPYSRFEFRFKNVRSTDIYSLTERLQRYINDLSISMQRVESQRINDLFALWEQESKTGCTTQTKNFSEFVRRYSNDIFTRAIAKGLYTKICNGNFDSWLKWFRHNNNIEFINKTEIECIAKEMKTALNLYIENG